MSADTISTTPDDVWGVYCAAFAGWMPDRLVTQREENAALAIGAHDRAKGSPPRARIALLAEVERLLTAEAPKVSALDVVVRLETWLGNDDDSRSVDLVIADLRREMGGAS